MEPKTIILQRNIGNDFNKFTNNEPMTSPKNFDALEKERATRVEEFEHVNGNSKKLTAEQKKILAEQFDWKLNLMSKGDRCYNLMSFEEVNADDTIQTGAYTTGATRTAVVDGKQTEVDVMQNYFTGYDGIVKAAKETTNDNTAKKGKARYYFVVV